MVGTEDVDKYINFMLFHDDLGLAKFISERHLFSSSNRAKEAGKQDPHTVLTPNSQLCHPNSTPASQVQPPGQRNLQAHARLNRAAGFRLRLGLLLLILLQLLLLLLVLLLILSLQVLDLLVRLGDRFEEALKAGLLAGLEVLGQPCGAGPHAVLAEALLRHEELHQPVDVRGIPFELAVWVVGRPHIGVEEEVARVGVGPVFGEHQLGFPSLDGLDDLLQRAVFADQLQGRMWADFWNRVEVVAAQEDAEVGKLHLLITFGEKLGVTYLFAVHVKATQDFVEEDFLDGFFTLLTECKVP